VREITWEEKLKPAVNVKGEGFFQLAVVDI
jgi:hypothetical protein